jgi:hypothetical protein
MSIKLMHEVYAKELDHAKQAVLLAMADHADDEGWNCFPSMDRIAYKTGYKPRNVIRVVKELREIRALVIVADATAQKPTEYRICLEALPDKPPFPQWRAEHGRSKGRGAGFAPVQPGVARGAKKADKGVAPSTPKQLVKPSYKPNRVQAQKSRTSSRYLEGYEHLDKDAPGSLEELRRKLESA